MRLKNSIKEYYSRIKADEALKNNVRQYLAAKTGNFSGGAKRTHFMAPIRVLVAFVIIIAAGGIIFFTPTAEIGMEINPAIEMSVNGFNTVVYAKGLNPDGEKLLNSLDLRYKSYHTAFDEIIGDNTVKALLANDEILSVTVSGINSAQTGQIYSQLENCPESGAGVRCQYVPANEYRAARSLGMSCGKYRAYLYLQELGSNVSPEEINAMKMKDIRTLIGELSGGNNLYGADKPYCKFEKPTND